MCHHFPMINLARISSVCLSRAVFASRALWTIWWVAVATKQSAMETLMGVTQETVVAMETASQGGTRGSLWGGESGRARLTSVSPSKRQHSILPVLQPGLLSVFPNERGGGCHRRLWVCCCFFLGGEIKLCIQHITWISLTVITHTNYFAHK